MRRLYSTSNSTFYPFNSLIPGRERKWPIRARSRGCNENDKLLVRLIWRAFGVALRGVQQSKTPAYFGLECGVFNPIWSAIHSATHNSSLFWIGVRIALQKFRSAKCPAPSMKMIKLENCGLTGCKWSNLNGPI